VAWVNRDKCAIVGIGATPYYVRGQSWPQTTDQLAGEAIMAACADAGIDVKDIDGFAYYSGAGAGYTGKMDTADFMEQLGIREVGFTAALTSGGGGMAGTGGLATAAIMNGDATYVVSVMALQQLPQSRLGTVFGQAAPTAHNSFMQPSGLVGPGHLMSVLARRHMHLYGTTRDAFFEIVQTQREHAMPRETAVRRKPLTREEYFASPMLADPLCRLDFCLETDGAVAFITTTAERAKDLRQKPVYIHASRHGGTRAWGRAFGWMGMPDPTFASSGHKPVADRLWADTGLTAKDIDVALLYDHFSAMVLMQLEDYGFCEKGEGNDFVLSGKLRYANRKQPGAIPLNTHGGQLSEAYIIGMTHVREAVEQLRGTAVNQVEDAEFALVTGGPAAIPTSGMILRR